MGAMYWQLNDIWQAPTWASLEYGGKWKMLHYFARHFFAPLLISPYLNGDTVCVDMIADQIPVVENRHPVTGHLTFRPDYSSGLRLSGQLHMSLYSWQSFTPLRTWVQPYSMNKTTELIFCNSMSTIMKQGGCNQGKNFCFLFFHLGDPSNEPVAWQPLTEYKSIVGLENSVVQVADVQQAWTTDKQVFNVTITTNTISVFVWLDTQIKGRFSDNGFLMVTPKKIVQFLSSQPVNVSDLHSSLSVRSLSDVYH